MADTVLHAENRTEHGSRTARRLRRAGQVPAVVYGLGAETLSVAVPARQLDQILVGGANSLITLDIDGSEALALARQVQRHPTRGELLHVDFVRVRRDVAVAAEVALHLTGEAVGVRDGGLLEQQVFHLPIEAKPQDIPHEVEMDVSALGIGDQLHARDVTLPPGVTATIDPDTLVAQVVAPRVQETAEGDEGVEAEAGATAEAAEAAPSEGAAESDS
jgi:large subunit ribosomal protein L25